MPPRSNGQAGPAAARRAERVWREHRRWVAAILLATKPRETELEDLLQSVALAVVRGIADVRGGEEAIKPWLRSIALNTARAAGRKATVRRNSRAERAAPQGSAAGTAPEVAEEGRRLLERALDLPGAYREPLLLRCVRGMSYRQIAEVTGLPETTIETRIARGRRMLRDAALNHQEQTTAVHQVPSEITS